MIEDIQAAIPLGFFLAFMIGPVFFVLLETSVIKGFRAALAFDLGVILAGGLNFALGPLKTEGIAANFCSFALIISSSRSWNLSFLRASRYFLKDLLFCSSIKSGSSSSSFKSILIFLILENVILSICFLTSETSPREEIGIMIVSGLLD